MILNLKKNDTITNHKTIKTNSNRDDSILNNEWRPDRLTEKLINWTINRIGLSIYYVDIIWYNGKRNKVVVESLQKQCYFYTYQNSCFIP